MERSLEELVNELLGGIELIPNQDNATKATDMEEEIASFATYLVEGYGVKQVKIIVDRAEYVYDKEYQKKLEEISKLQSEADELIKRAKALL